MADFFDAVEDYDAGRQRRRVEVHYSIGTYAGSLELVVDADAERGEIISRAKRVLRQRAGGSLPFGAESYQLRTLGHL